MADECRDSAGRGEEKLALFFRYVWYDEETNTFSVHEDFVCFLHCERTSGEELFKVLMGGEDGGYMGRNQIPLQNGRGQGYDGAGNMTGLHNGLQARVRNLYPKMHFHWCSGHCLNLCLAKACEKVKKVVDHVQEITIAFKYSAKREQYFKEAILADSEI